MLPFDNYAEPRYQINADKGAIIGRTEVMLDLFNYLNHLADLPTTVLLTGETGTGKELCARALHYNSNGLRKKNNFVVVNCAGIPSELLESELFGYVKGAFTGAYRDTPGKFQHADNGTILLDEIGDMNVNLQAKILRVLQEKKITKVGSNKVEPVDTRVIAATNRNLEEEVSKGNFRADLYYRLNVVPVKVPSLSERAEDIPLIAEYFVEQFNEAYGAHIEALSLSAQEKLQRAHWKGNVRELENIIERVFILKREGIIEAEDLCFNSDMPRRRPVQAPTDTKVAEATFEEPAERTELAGTIESMTTEPKIVEPARLELPPTLWYQRGVLPLSPMALSGVAGAKSYGRILQMIRTSQNKRYFELVGLGEQWNNPLVFVTRENLAEFFHDQNTEEYRALEREIKVGRFNQIVQAPFKFFSVSALVNHEDTWKHPGTIKRAAKKAAAYSATLGRSFCFAVTLDNAQYFVPLHFLPQLEKTWEEKIENLKTQVRFAYERFRTWAPR